MVHLLVRQVVEKQFMKNRNITSFAPIEIRRFILPLTLATIFVMVGIILNGTLVEPRNVTLIIYGIA